MPTRDTSRPGLVANCMFAAIWAALGIWTSLTPGPEPWRWLLPVGYLALAVLFVVLGARRHRAAKRATESGRPGSPSAR